MTTRIQGILARSRFMVMLSVIGSLIAAVVLMVYGLISVIAVSAYHVSQLFEGQLVLDHTGVEGVAVEFLAIIDIFLLSTVFYIVSLGLYELFIDTSLPLPRWLEVETLDELKVRIIGVVIVLFGVNFLTAFVPSEGDPGILRLGIAAAIVIVALTIAARGLPHQDKSVTPLSVSQTDAIAAHIEEEARDRAKAWREDVA